VVSIELNEFLGKDWAAVAQAFRLTRTVQEKGVSRVEVVSSMTSLSPTQASAQQLLTLVRGHWAIEIACIGDAMSP
jgi:hypothetical protein